MRILLVGAGGVGTAFARIAARRPFADLIVADYDLSRAQRRRGRQGQLPGGPAGRPGRGRHRGAAGRALLRRADERHRPALRACPLFGAALQAGTHYLDMAMSLSRPHPQRAVRADRRQARRRAVRAGRAVGAGRASWRWSGSASSRACPTSSPGYAADQLFSEIDELGVRDGANLEVAGYDFAPDLLDLDHDRGVPQPAGHLGEGPRLVHHRAVQRAGGLQLPGRDRPGGVRERGARGGAADAALGRRPSGSPSSTAWARSSSACCGPCTSSAWTRTDPVAGRRRPGLAPRRGGRLPARPGHAGRQDDRPDLRRHLGHRDRQGRRAARGLPAPRGGQRLVDGRVRLPGRGLADRGQPGGGPGADRLRAPGPAPGCSAPRRCPPARSWTCSPTTDPPGPARNAPRGPSKTPKYSERRARGGGIAQLHRRSVDGHELRPPGRADRPEHRGGLRRRHRCPGRTR